MNASVLWDSAIHLIITSNSKKVWWQTDNGVPYKAVEVKGKVREVHRQTRLKKDLNWVPQGGGRPSRTRLNDRTQEPHGIRSARRAQGPVAQCA